MWLVVIVLAVASSSEVQAAERGPSVTAFAHKVWTAKDGAPADVWAITQTNDGWLWFGGRDGLRRFDGVRFEAIDVSVEGSGLSNAVSAMYALRSGGLAIGHLSGGITVLKEGKVKVFTAAQTHDLGPVQDFAEDRAGTIWAATLTGLLRFDGRSWQRVGAEWNYPGGRSGSPFVDADDTLWISAGKDIFWLPSGSHRFQRSGTRVDSAADFIQTPDGRVWYTDTDGTRLLDSQSSSPVPMLGVMRKSYSAIFDRQGNYWTTWPHVAIALPEPAVQHLGTISTNLKTIYEDREGGLWLSEIGAVIHRFIRPSIVTSDARKSFRSWPWANIALDSSDQLWMATMHSGNFVDPDDGVWKLSGTLRRMQKHDISSATTIARDPFDTVWIGGRQGLWKLSEGRFERAIELPEAARGAYVNGLSVQCSGGLWVSVRNVGLLQHDGVAWRPNGNVQALPTPPPVVQTCDSSQHLWLGYLDGTVATVADGRATLFSAGQGLQVGTVSAISVVRHTLVGGERGVALLRGGRFVRLRDGIAALAGTTSILELPSGDVWLNGAHGIARIEASQLDKVSESGEIDVSVELFDESDGYPGPGFNLAGPRSTLALTRSNRIWMAADGGLATIDLAQLRPKVIAPPVVIESVTVGNRSPEPARGMQLAAGTRSLEIDYTALEYSHPDRLRFRYRLAGADDGWVDAVTRRQAFYTNLGPGRYQFVVNVTNANGTWTDSSASLDFVIPPTFVQSRLFLAACALMALALVGLAYRMNVRRVVSRQKRLIEERLGERERIARELHDTLLQGTQALIYNLHVAVGAIPEDSSARPRLADALRSAENAMTEGRDRIQDLRGGPDTPEGLEQSLAHEGGELARNSRAAFTIVVEGRERAVRPEVVTLGYRIAREAMVNAFRHADAHSIEVRIGYLEHAFRLCVVDDGTGIEARAFEKGSRPGHWGLPGMRERSHEIGATLAIWSRPGAGTEIELSVPATIAYGKEAKRSRWLPFDRSAKGPAAS